LYYFNFYIINLICAKTSKYIGVCWEPVRKRFVAAIKIKGKSKSLGRFINEIDAHNAYQKAMAKYGIANKYAPTFCA